MPSLASLARVTRRGGAVTPPGITMTSNIEDSLETKCWLIYTAMMEAASRSGGSWSQPVTDETGRVLTTDSLKRHVRDLYPAAVDWSDPAATAEFTKPIYRYLRLSGNARIVQRNPGGDPNKAIWSLAPEWGAGEAIAAKVRVYTPSRTEQKVTPTEAGEDRTPEPVVVTRPTPTPQEELVSKKKRGEVSNDDWKVVDGGFLCPFPGCGDVRPTIMGARGHYGSKHRQRNKFPVGGSAQKPKTPTEVKPKTIKPGGALDKQSPNAALVGHGYDLQAIQTGDPALPWGCPFPGCGQKFAKFQGIGGHFSKHNAAIIRDRLAAAEAQVEALRNPDPSTLVDFVVHALTAPKAAPEDKTKMETLQIEVNRLQRKEAELLSTVADQQSRLDKAQRQIAALLAVE